MSENNHATSDGSEEQEHKPADADLDSLPADFNPETYLRLNPDVAAGGVDARQHYVTSGRKEGRAYRSAEVDLTSLPEDFDADTYLRLNPDVAAGEADARQHYVTFGRSEGRTYKKIEIYIDEISGGTITGWVRRPVELTTIPTTLYIDGKIAGTSLANEFRDDLRSAGYFRGEASFNFDIPDDYLDDGQHLIEIAAGETFDKNVVASQKAFLHPPNEETIYAISMVRNEADIIRAFLSQCNAIFDKTIIIDHQSTDGTKEILSKLCSSSNNFQLLDYRHRGYYQSQISTAAARYAFEQGATWVFFLDADEFLPVKSRKDLIGRLSKFRGRIMNLRWMNLVPTNYGNFCNFDTRQIFKTKGELSTYGKVAVHRAFFEDFPDLVIHQGNHAISKSVDSAPAEMYNGLYLRHIPIRSLERLRYKIENGTRAYQAKDDRSENEGSHWFQLREHLSNHDPSEWLDRVVENYGQPLDLTQPGSEDDGKQGTEVMTDFPSISQNSPHVPCYSLQEVRKSDNDQHWLSTKFVKGAQPRAFIDDAEIRIAPQIFSANGPADIYKFPSLAHTDLKHHDSLKIELIQALSKSFEPIGTVVESAWTEHVPFLFGLFALLKPRRYVELGTHRGMSLFAASQASKHIKPSTECIGIDGWLGDEHAGFYENEVFDKFRAMFKETAAPNSYFIRSYFDDALDCFETASIDILHIDGLHTYDAVKHDFETWSKKLSDRGVILFHDVNVYERGFGVWHLWNELSEKYPSIVFNHSYGLGLIAMGQNNSEIRAVIELINSNGTVREALQTLFSELGQMSVRRTILEQDLYHERNARNQLQQALSNLRS